MVFALTSRDRTSVKISDCPSNTKERHFDEGDALGLDHFCLAGLGELLSCLEPYLSPWVRKGERRGNWSEDVHKCVS